MHEELTGDGEHFVETEHTKVRRVITEADVAIDLDALWLWLKQSSPVDVRAELQRWVIDFIPPAVPTSANTALLEPPR
jgi:hypothetical protein